MSRVGRQAVARDSRFDPFENSIFFFLEIQHPLKCQPFDLLQSAPGDALQVTVHADCRLHDAVDLFFTLGPLSGDGVLLTV